MASAHVDALLETATDGIAFDGLSVTQGENGYRFQTLETEQRGLTDDELRTLASDSPYVTDWYFWHALAPQKPDRWAFCRWLEGADGTPVPERYEALDDGQSVEWGQLHITVTLEISGDGTVDGQRSYDIRHVEDADVDPDTLETYEEPLDARELARVDDSGRYRPLKAAPSLQTGWQFVGLDAVDVVSAVESFYPATIPNWHREREEELDVTHWHETTARQTGIYSVVETWDRGEGHEHVEWVAETHCTDESCLKRREWEYDAETPLETDRGEGVFPCREPCSLVISGARKYTRLDAEETRRYEFELTPSEKEQLEELIDAVADGQVDEIREADFGAGANRYRARFLRARRFDDEGRLCGVETDGK